MQLVVLAAGHGRRFGGLKQLAPIGPNGEALMDYTASAALACGYDEVVLVVRDDIEDEIVAHVKSRWPRDLAVRTVQQLPGISGTAQAVLSASPALEGPFAVANADDLYGEPALEAIARHFSDRSGSGTLQGHLLVAYRLVRTVLTAEPVTRGLCKIRSDGTLEAIVEHVMELRDDGQFDARPLRDEDAPPKILSGVELVSMNLWGFDETMLDYIDEALNRLPLDRTLSRELILVEVINEVVFSNRDRIDVIETN